MIEIVIIGAVGVIACGLLRFIGSFVPVKDEKDTK